MTRSITPITAATGGEPADNQKTQPTQGLPVLREKEGRALISLACDALYEVSNLAHDLHAQLYAKDPAEDRHLQQLNGDALTCLETAEHYLRMLGSVLEERIPSGPVIDPWSVEPAF